MQDMLQSGRKKMGQVSSLPEALLIVSSKACAWVAGQETYMTAVEGPNMGDPVQLRLEILLPNLL